MSQYFIVFKAHAELVMWGRQSAVGCVLNQIEFDDENKKENPGNR